MQRIYQGKTKDVYKLQDGNILLQFKDDATGTDGVFDPGANTVGLTIEGLGLSDLRLSAHFFRLLEEKGVHTHFIEADEEKATMTVKAATPFGQGVEVICRYRAVGSFVRRYGLYVESGAPLDAYIEVTLKDDERNDPLITREGLAMLGIMTGEEYDLLAADTRSICAIIKEDLASRGLELYDIKLEFGRVEGKVCLVDEISAGNMRVYEGGEIVGPLDLAKKVLG